MWFSAWTHNVVGLKCNSSLSAAQSSSCFQFSLSRLVRFIFPLRFAVSSLRPFAPQVTQHICKVSSFICSKYENLYCSLHLSYFSNAHYTDQRSMGKMLMFSMRRCKQTQPAAVPVPLQSLLSSASHSYHWTAFQCNREQMEMACWFSQTSRYTRKHKPD